MKSAAPFRRCNLSRLPLQPEIAHDGDGSIQAFRIASQDQLAGAIEFIDYAELPPGSSIGDHRHSKAEEEYYLVLSGSGLVRLEAEQVPVTAGELVRNPAGGLHGLRNTGADTLRIFIFAVHVESTGCKS
jgi:mannose-6-phosphate isomerase-like protein (cupin superfamily)